MEGEGEAGLRLINEGKTNRGHDESRLPGSWLGSVLAANITAVLVALGAFAVSNAQKPIVDPSSSQDETRATRSP